MIENYVSMKKETNFLFVFLDPVGNEIQEFKNSIEGEESELACMLENLNLEELKKIYSVTDEEAILRNGLQNAIYNSIALRNLR